MQKYYMYLIEYCTKIYFKQRNICEEIRIIEKIKP